MVNDMPQPKIDLKNLIVFVPLAVITVFCLSFAQMKAVNTQNIQKQEAELTQPLPTAKPLPLVTQPVLPTLTESIEIKAPAPVPPPTNQYERNSQKSDLVGPSSKNSGNALQPNTGNLNSGNNNDLQATRKAIRLEDAKL